MMDSPSSQTQSLSSQVVTSKSSRSTKGSKKFASLRGIIRFPVKRARAGSISNASATGTNMANDELGRSLSRSSSRQNHHNRSQSTNYTPPPSAFGNSPYGRHSMNLVMKPYMSQPMLGLGHTRDADGHGTVSMDMSGDEGSSYSATPERSPVRREAASSAANVLRVAPWAVSTPSNKIPSHGTQTRALVPQSTPGRSSQDQGTPAPNGTSSTASVTQKPSHSRKLSTHSISNAIVNKTQAGLAALGVKSRRTSVDEMSRPQTSSGTNVTGRSLAPKWSNKGQLARPSTSAGETDSRPPAVPSKDPPSSNTTLHSTIRRTNAPTKPLPPEPVEPAISLVSTTSNARSPSSSLSSPPRSITKNAEVTHFPNPQTPRHPKSPTQDRPPHRAPPTPNSNPKPGAESHTTGLPKDHAYIQVSKTTSDMSSQPTAVKLSAMRAQDGAPAGSTSTSRSRPPSGALAPAATSLTVSQNPTHKIPSSTPTSGPRSNLPTPKRSMTTGDDTLHLNLPPFNPRLTLHEYLESNSARLSPSVILRPPPLPLINLPVLSTPTVHPTGSETDGSGQLRRSLSAAGTSRGVMKCMPALLMQGTSRGTRGHEEVDDMEDDDEDDMDEEGEELEDTSTNPNSASTGRMSMDSQTSTDDASSENLTAEQDANVPSSWSRLGHRISAQSLSRSSSYQTALTGDEYETSAVEPSPISPEPYHGNPNRPPDKRFSRAPHLARVDTSGLQLDFSVWDQKFTPKTPKPVGSLYSALAPSQVQQGSWNLTSIDKRKAKLHEGQLSGGEIGESLLANGEVSGSAFGGTKKTLSDRGNVDVRVSEGGMAGSRHSAMEVGRRLEGEAESSDHLTDVTESTTHITAAAGTSLSPKSDISSLPGRGLDMDYFVYRNSPQHTPLGTRRDDNPSDEAATISDPTLPDMTPTMTSTPIMTSIITNSTTTNITRGASPLRTPRPADYRLSVAATTPPIPMSPLLSGLSPLVPSKVSDARLSVTMGNLGHRGGLYKIASRSLIDVHEIEMKEKVEKMVEDAEDAAERELKARKRSMKRSSVQAKVANDVLTPKVDSLRIDTVHRRVSQATPNRDNARTTPHSADPVMAGATKHASMFSPVVFADLTSPASPSNDEIQSRRISAAPAYDAHPHPLRRRRSMPTFNPSTAPPPYPDFSPYGVRRDLILQPRDDEGAEKLPAYSNNIYLRAVLPRKMEFSHPGVQAKDRKWRKVLCVLDGTAFKVYKLPAATGVSAIGEWFENKIGAGDVSEGTHHQTQTAGGTSGVRITTDTSQLNVAVTDVDSPASGEDRKRAEGGETGAPILQRNNSTHAAQSLSPPPHSPQPTGNRPGPSLAVASTRSALTLAVQLLKPSPRQHGRSNSDVAMSPSQPRSPRASLNISRSERTTPTISPPPSSFRSQSPSASTHLTTPSSSSAGFSRPTTPSSSISVGASTSSRAGQGTSLNTPRSQNQSPSDHSYKGKGKEKNEVPEPDEADLIRAYTMQHAESGLGKDYLKRQHVIRVRLEGEQFLLQAPTVDGVIAWIEGLQAAANVALDLDERSMPAGPIFPRRRRRRRPAVLPGFETNNNNNANADVVTVSPTIPNGPLSGVRPLERAAGRRT